MSDIQDLIDTANRLCNNLDVMAANDKKFCADITLTLEQYSWNAYCIAENLKYIKNLY